MTSSKLHSMDVHSVGCKGVIYENLMLATYGLQLSVGLRKGEDTLSVIV